MVDVPTARSPERLRAFLEAFGAPDHDLAYRGSPRSGYVEPPGAATQSGMLHSPLDLRQLLRSEFWHGPTQFGEGFSQAATMLQPVGGMGRIGDALGRRLGTIITYNAEVIALRRSGEDARVIWRDRASGAEQTAEAPFVLCTIPFPVLSRLDTDFKPAVKLAIARLDYIPAAKVAFRAARRFWELDDQIYGGISWTNREITQMWYPSSGFHERQGIIVGAYVWTAEIGEVFAASTPARRLETALVSGERLRQLARISEDYLRLPPTRHREARERRLFASTSSAICCTPGAPFKRTNHLELEISFGDPEYLAASLFAFSATFEICRDDTICRQGSCQNSGRPRDSLTMNTI